LEAGALGSHGHANQIPLKTCAQYAAQVDSRENRSSTRVASTRCISCHRLDGARNCICWSNPSTIFRTQLILLSQYHQSFTELESSTRIKMTLPHHRHLHGH
jgi:hypothetical protein